MNREGKEDEMGDIGLAAIAKAKSVVCDKNGTGIANQLACMGQTIRGDLDEVGEALEEQEEQKGTGVHRRDA